MRKFFWLFFLPMLFAGCAEQQDGTFVMNEETIENFIEGDREGLKSYNPPADLNLLWDQPVIKADIPSLAPGRVRLFGVLNSVGRYKIKNGDAYARDLLRGSDFRQSVYGMLGNAAPDGTAWFFVDINAISGQVAQGRAYLYGFESGVCDLRQPNGGSYGEIGNQGFSISLDGPCLFPAISGSTSEYVLLIEGSGDILAMPRDSQVNVRYIVSDSGDFKKIPKNPDAFQSIYDYGTGIARLVK